MGSNRQPGEFQEGQTRELILPHVSVDAFDVMIRSAYHMEPKLTPHRALHALAAAKLYMIDGLEKYCYHYLLHITDVDGITSLILLSESLKSSLALPAELQRTFCKKVLAHCQQVVESPFFLETHGSIIATLIKSDNFDVSEDQLWDRLMKWSAAAVRKPGLLGPFADATSCPPLKRAKSSTGESNSMNPHQVTCQEEVLRLMVPHIRFTQMSQEFFIDKARKYLDREKSEAVMDFFVLCRNPEGLVLKPRFALLSLQNGGASRLVTSSLETRFTGTQNRTVHLGELAQVTRVRVSISNIVGKAVTWSVSLAGRRSEEVVVEKDANIDFSLSRLDIRFENACKELVVEFDAVSVTVRYIMVEGRKMTPELELADQVVDQLCKDFFPAPERDVHDTSQ